MMEIDLHIAAPVERVFACMTNFAHAPEHIPGIKRVEMLTDGPVGVGTKFKETRVMFGKEATETMEVSRFDAPRSYTLGAVSCGMAYESIFHFEPDGAGTRLKMQFQGKPLTLVAKLLSPITKLLMGGMMRKCLLADMEGMKRAAEKQ